VPFKLEDHQESRTWRRLGIRQMKKLWGTGPKRGMAMAIGRGKSTRDPLKAQMLVKKTDA
jgi:hypothetical protein